MNSMKNFRMLGEHRSAFKIGLGFLCAFLFIFAGMYMLGIYFGEVDLLTTGGTSFASMMLIGDVGDVSDRDTHGSNICYEVYLVSLDQIDKSALFPVPNASREVASIPMLEGQYMKHFDAYDIPTFNSNGEKGDINTTGTKTFGRMMGGMRDPLLNFSEEYAGSKFGILVREIGTTQWNILGNADSPMVLKSYDAKNDKEGRYITYTFERSSIYQYYKYVGTILRLPAATHTAGQTTLAISSNSSIDIPDGASATYAINAISGLTANDKGRIIVLNGTGSSKAATIGDGAAFVLEDGATWTAKAGSNLTLRVLDPTTLIEVQGSRIQTP